MSLDDFKFMPMWLNHPIFINIVKKAWSMEFHGNPNDKVRACQGALKALSRVWNKEFGNVHERVRELFEKINVLQAQSMDDPNNLQLLTEETMLRNELNRTLSNEDPLC